MYTKTNWVARVGTALNRFLKTNETSGSVELTADPTGVSTPGTPFTTDNMNKIEQGIEDAHYPTFTEASTLENIASGEVQETLWGKVKKAIAYLIANVNQGVKTTDSPTFANATIASRNVDTQLGASQSHIASTSNPHSVTRAQLGLASTDVVNFATLNPPIDNNDSTIPAVGVGGFTTGLSAVSGGNMVFNIPSGGTYIYITERQGNPYKIGRVAGGTSLSDPIDSTDRILLWRIA